VRDSHELSLVVLVVAIISSPSSPLDPASFTFSLASLITMGQSRPYHSTFPLAPVPSCIRCLTLTITSPLTHAQHHNLWKTWSGGPTVCPCISHHLPRLSTTDRCLVRCVCLCGCLCVVYAVNAHELERLKKRFMKLDRCVSHTFLALHPTVPPPRILFPLPPTPNALCPNQTTFSLSLALSTRAR